MNDATPHHCAWRDETDDLKAKLAERDEVIAKQSEMLEAVAGQLAVLQEKVFGGGQEKMPTPSDALRKERRGKGGKPKRGDEKRKSNAAARKKLPEREFVHHVRDEDKSACTDCGEPPTRKLGDGKVTTLYEFVPAHFEQHKHIRETLVCPCGSHIVTADGPAKVVDKGRYGPGLMAHIITDKCADSLPLYRIAKRYHRYGVPIARSTIGTLFHNSAEAIKPLYKLIFSHIAAQTVVQADETPMAMQAKGKCRKGYLWTFLCDDAIGYRFSGSRSGETPVVVLGGTKGTLVVDGYSGYNVVCTPESRQRAGCLAHARRKFFQALKTAPDLAERAMALILDVYRVEHDMAEAGLIRTAQHQKARRTRSGAAMAELRALIDAEKGRHLKKGPMGKALTYADNQWAELTRFVDDVGLPVDNNASERALRVVALGRKNFMFVGHVEAGQNLAVLYTMVANCELHGVNPLAYLTDVLPRVQHTRASLLPDLLPWNWTPPDVVVHADIAGSD